jgi:DMSO/TMAO reductase YedYZ heme-binding membrane subunit
MVTTQKIIKNAIGSKTWRSIHIISYGTCILYLYHGVVMDPLLKDRAIDFLDGEKLLIELLGLILIIAFYWRYHYKQNKLKA